MPINTLFKLWDQFWFSECSPLAVALYRIFFGIIQTIFVLLLTEEMSVWFGEKGILGNQTVSNFNGSVRLNVLNFDPANPHLLMALFVIFFLASICLVLGYKTRLAAIVSFILYSSLYHRDPFLFNSGDTYMRVSCFWLIFSAAGQALSLDSWLENKRKGLVDPMFTDFKYAPVSMWAYRLLQLQLALVYLHTMVCKFWGPVWYDGTAVYYSSRIEDLIRVKLPYVFENLWTINLLTWGTLILETGLFTLIWIKELRYYVIACAIIFHLIIDLHMNIPLFEWEMIISYVLFIEAKHLERALVYIREKLKKLQKREQPAHT